MQINQHHEVGIFISNQELEPIKAVQSSGQEVIETEYGIAKKNCGGPSFRKEFSYLEYKAGFYALICAINQIAVGIEATLTCEKANCNTPENGMTVAKNVETKIHKAKGRFASLRSVVTD